MQKFILLIAAFLLTSSCVTPQQLNQASVSQFAKMREELNVSENQADRAFVHCVADALIVQLDEPYRSYEWDLELFDEDEVNAFAMPGGQIGVFTGLFKTATNQDQLAAVIGHEIAHVTRGHSLRRANSQQAANIGILVGSMASEVVRDNVGAIVLGAQLGLLLPYGRAQESQADMDGLDLMAKAGFDPEESIQLWRNMAEESPNRMPQFLSTHPSSSNRIRQLDAQQSAVQPLYQQARSSGLAPSCSR